MNVSSDLQATLDTSRKSWIEAANDPACDFSIQNLPFGIFSDARNSAPRVGVAIGDSIVDLAVLQASGLLRLPGASTSAAASEPVFSRDTLNDFIATSGAPYVSS
jgi:fumarylacetoacetase